jgi:phage gpG-like protein
VAQAGIRVDTSELDRALDRFGDEIAHASTTHAAVVRGILPGVMLRTPRRSGRLAGSWRTSGEDDRGVISTDVDYAAPIEFGVPSHGIRPYAMVEQAIAAETSTIEKQYEDELRKIGRHAGFETK